MSVIGRQSLAPMGFQQPAHSRSMTGNPSHALSALQRCVSTLQQSDTLQYELVSEHDIIHARAAIAKDTEPELTALIKQAKAIILELEDEETQLMDRKQLLKEQQLEQKQKQQQQQQQQQQSSSYRNGKKGRSNSQRLDSLIKRKDELSLTVLELDSAMDEKREEFRVLLTKAHQQQQQQQQPQSSQKKGQAASTTTTKTTSVTPATTTTDNFGSGKKTKRNPDKMQDERRKEISRRTLALETIERDIQSQRRQIADLKTKKQQQDGHVGQDGGQDGATQSTKEVYNPAWTKYSQHYDFLEGLLSRELRVSSGKDKDQLETEFSKLSTAYVREVGARQEI
ncbi:hypothetical protein BG004_008350, partial [Podila humilis]